MMVNLQALIHCFRSIYCLIIFFQKKDYFYFKMEQQKIAIFNFTNNYSNILNTKRLFDD